MRPELTGLDLADAPELWAALGFSVRDEACDLGRVRLRLGGAGEGIRRWSLTGIGAGVSEIDGLATETTAAGSESSTHPNGTISVDHVVVVTADFDRTAAALECAGLPLRRVREVPGSGERPAFRQGFRRLGPAILELVETPAAEPGAARFWGLVLIVDDLEALADRLGDRLGSIRDAVQPGRRIATLRESAGLGEAVAFMSPEPR